MLMNMRSLELSSGDCSDALEAAVEAAGGPEDPEDAEAMVVPR